MSFLGNPKNVFWEAFLLTVIVFIFGLFLGYTLERSRTETLSDYYVQSEISLLDSMSLYTIVSEHNLDCGQLKQTTLNFADRIYEEAKVLGRYDGANKLDDSIRLVYRRYDLLRTLLWTTAISTQEQCGSEHFSIVVYVYERETDDLARRAEQQVWSRILGDLKEAKGSELALIPISADDNIASLQSLLSLYGVTEFPVVIVNGKAISQLESVDSLEQYLA